MIINTTPTVPEEDAGKFDATGSFEIENGTYPLRKDKYTYGEIVIAIRYL